MLAAGIGTRMLPITKTIPKPLIRVNGTTLLDHNLNTLERAAVDKVVVNVHHHADQIEEHVEARTTPNIVVSDERDQLLDSGGGTKMALSKLGNEPFYLLNSDSFWIEGARSNLLRLAEFWNPGDMDILLLVTGMAGAIGFDTRGDFQMDDDGRLIRRQEQEVAPFAYAGAAILNPVIFANTPDYPFSLNSLFDKALEQGRLFGLRLEGLWLHVGTPDAIRKAEEAIAKSAA